MAEIGLAAGGNRCLEVVTEPGDRCPDVVVGLEAVEPLDGQT
jgi:hypothetical protein